MRTKNEQFVVDGSGNRTAVLLDVKRYFELLEAQEDLDSIRAFDEAKSSQHDAVPFEQAVKEMDEAQKLN